MTTNDVLSLLRDNIRNLKPYTSARDEFTGTAQIFIDANENPIGSVGGSNNNRYPDPYQRELKGRIAALKGVPAEHIFLGNGSDEAIDLLFKAFCRPGIDKAIATPPTYGMYQVSADVNEVEIEEVSLTEDFQLNVPALLNHGFDKVKMLFLCSPNNPTGNLLKRADIEQVLRNFNGIVIVDEAYIDFSPEKSWSLELAKYPNLVVLQTFSKAWGLAAVRLGIAYASTEIIAVLNKIKLPYNISGPAQEAAFNALSAPGEKDRMVAAVLEERARLEAELVKFDSVLHIYPSDANFLLVKTTAPNELYDFLVDNEIVVRNRSRLALCEGCLRITVGTAEENTALLKAFSQFA